MTCIKRGLFITCLVKRKQ